MVQIDSDVAVRTAEIAKRKFRRSGFVEIVLCKVVVPHGQGCSVLQQYLLTTEARSLPRANS